MKTQITKQHNLCKISIVTACLMFALLTSSANAVTNELVSSSESHSIEKFNSSGTWTSTFASTGPWIPVGIAASPVTGDVFAATLTKTILRYQPTGAPFGTGGAFWSTFDVSPYFNGNPVESLLFDSSGNLYVSSHYGTSGYQVMIIKFSALQLLGKTPVPSGLTIITTVGRGDQMAFDFFGNICIASFLAPNTVQCYNPRTGVLAFDYAAEFAGFYPLIQPIGLTFSPYTNNLYVSSVFAGQVDREVTEHSGPMVTLASGLTSDIGYIATDIGRRLYVPSFHNAGNRYGTCLFYACNDYDTSADVVYKIDQNSGTVTTFISTHLWGPYQMIFVPF